jgi:hypothetical protein
LFFIFSFLHLKVLLIYWVEHACYFPSSHGFINSPFEFYSLLAPHVCKFFFLVIFCMNYFLECPW